MFFKKFFCLGTIEKDRPQISMPFEKGLKIIGLLIRYFWIAGSFPLTTLQYIPKCYPFFQEKFDPLFVDAELFKSLDQDIPAGLEDFFNDLQAGFNARYFHMRCRRLNFTSLNDGIGSDQPADCRGRQAPAGARWGCRLRPTSERISRFDDRQASVL